MNDSVLKLLKERYFLPEENSWEDLAKRVSFFYPEIYEDILNFVFIPSSPTLMNGNTMGKRRGTLSSCFPMGIEDSIEGIFKAVEECALVTRAGGGVGYDFSTLRGNKEIIKGINRVSSGPLYFLDVFNSTLNAIRQGGVRRGAGMALLSIDHPNILDFIKAKNNLSKFNYFNFSIKIPSSFYKMLEENPLAPHKVKNITDGVEYDLVDENGKIVTIKQLWDLIIKNSWLTAEPGIFNSDLAYQRSTVTNLDNRVISNPCAEFIGIPYQSCNLGSINLAALVENKVFNWKKFEEIIVKAVRFLNSVIDHNDYPLSKIKKMTLDTRPIGLGYMGLATALFKKEIPYNSIRACKFLEDVNSYLTIRGMVESVELAKKYGSYKAFDVDLFLKANERFFTKEYVRDINIKNLVEDIKKYGIRNSSITSIAPTGSISTIAGVSSGIEPVFALTYVRKISNEDKDVIFIVDPIFEEYLNNNFNEETKRKILDFVAVNKGSCQTCELIPEEKRKIFITASDLTPLEHLEMLAIASKWTSLSVSKTINLPSKISKEELSNVFLEAHKKGIIGVTCYRDGCREGVLVHNVSFVKNEVPKRPTRLPCEVHRVTYLGEPWIVFIGLLDDKPYEVFSGKIENVNIPKNITKGFLVKEKSKVYSFEYEGEYLVRDICKIFNNVEHDDFSRLISFSLRHGGNLLYLVETLNKASGNINKFSKVIARTLKKYIADNSSTGKICPSCSQPLVYESGCIVCKNCGWSKCG